MSCETTRMVRRALSARQQIEDVALHPLVDVGGGLVQDQDARLADQGAGEQDPLQLTAGECADAPPRQVQGLHLRQRRARRRSVRRPVPAERRPQAPGAPSGPPAPPRSGKSRGKVGY